MKKTKRFDQRLDVQRPQLPAGLGEEDPETFVPDHELARWIRKTFIDRNGPLVNAEHVHLSNAYIGVLWTNVFNRSQQRLVMGTAEIPRTTGGGWKRGRFDLQMCQWFGCVPTFLLTLYAPECAKMSDRMFCALVEHELSHCGLKGYSEVTGEPLFEIRGHDVEEFTTVVARYGATSEALREMVNAINQGPIFGDEAIDIACGVCLAKAA